MWDDMEENKFNIDSIKPKLKYFTEQEYEEVYNQWLTKYNNKDSKYSYLEKYGSKDQLNNVNQYINWRYYKEHPIYIREDDAGNHVNIMKEIGYKNYVECSTFWICLRRNAGKTTDGIINWLIKRWELYGERGAYIRKRDMDLKEFLKEMKKEFFVKLKPMGYVFDKGAILEIESGETVISFRNLTSQVNSSSSLPHTNIVYDEPIPIGGAIIFNEKDLLMQMCMSLYRDLLPIGRLMLTSNANTLRTPLLEGLYLDYDSFQTQTKQIVKNPYGSNIFVWLGFNIQPNRINSNFYGSPAGAFMDAEQYDFLENGTFAFSNHTYQWSHKAICITHYHAMYAFGNYKWVEVTAIHKKSREKKIVFVNYNQLTKELTSKVIMGCPLFVFKNSDVVDNPGSQLLTNPKEKIELWFRGMRQNAFRFTSYLLPEALQALFQTVSYGMEIW